MPTQGTKKENGIKCGKEETKLPLLKDDIAHTGNPGEPMNHSKIKENKYKYQMPGCSQKSRVLLYASSK